MRATVWSAKTCTSRKQNFKDQRNRNATGDIPSARKLPLMGEWTVCASSETSNLEGDTDASNAAVERMDDPSESKETEGTPGVTSEGCERGASESVSVGDAGHRTGPADMPNELTEFITLSVEPYVENGSDVPHVRLGGMRMQTDEANGPERRTDVSRAQADALNASNKAETAENDSTNVRRC